MPFTFLTPRFDILAGLIGGIVIGAWNTAERFDRTTVVREHVGISRIKRDQAELRDRYPMPIVYDREARG